MTLKTIYPVTKGNAVSRSVLFSKTILRTCLLKESSFSSSMDRYFKRPPQKFGHEFTTLGSVVCVLGKTGIGKTWAVHAALDPCVEITADILRSKQDTIQFLTKIKGTNIPVILDEYECVHDLAGTREITGAPTNGPFIIISQIPIKFDFEFVLYEFPVPDETTIKRIIPEASDESIQKSKGDLRFVIQSLTFKGDVKDEFQGARDFIESLISINSATSPINFIGHSVHEPGNVTAILHENYIDSKKCKRETISHLMSDAMLFEEKIYAGHWDLYPYYNILGCIMPAIEIGHALKPPLRPGSLWTKHQSACARWKRIDAAAQRVPGKRLSMDEILMLRAYALHNNVDILKEYKLVSQDLDVLNHLTYDPKNKIKPKDLTNLKKQMT